MPTALRTLMQLLRDRGANTALTFGLLLVPIAGGIGAAVDYARASSTRSAMQAAVDAAALGAARQLADNSKARTADLRAIAKTYFDKNFTESKDTSGAVDLRVKRKNDTIEVEASAKVPTTIMRLVGRSSVEITAQANSVVPRREYVDIYLLLDNSASMGLAATEQARDAMVAGIGCAFGCHTPEGRPQSNLDWARERNIRLRIDTLHDGVLNLLKHIDTVDPTHEHIRVGAFQFNTNLKQIADLSTNFGTLRTRMSDFDMGDATYFNEVMNDFVKAVGKGGDGSSRAKARKLVLLVTDGVESDRNWVLQTQFNHKVSAFDAGYCEKLRKNDVEVAVIYATYLPMPWDWGYNRTLGRNLPKGGKVIDTIKPTLQDCASNNLFLERVEDKDISGAFSELFDRYLNRIRLTR